MILELIIYLVLIMATLTYATVRWIEYTEAIEDLKGEQK